MKKAITILLTISLLIGVFSTVVSADTIFVKNDSVTIALFAIGGSNNKGGQEFVPDFELLSQIDVYLNNQTANNTVTVSVYKGSPAQSGSSLLGSQSFTLDEVRQGWFTFKFTDFITLTPGVKHAFVVDASKSAQIFGKPRGEDVNSDCCALNYDSVSIGGWRRENHMCGFKLTPYERSSHNVTSTPLFLISGANNMAGQEFSVNGNEIKSIKAYLDNSVANNTLTLNIYKGSVAEGASSLIYSKNFTLAETGAKWVEFNFDQSVKITYGTLYSFTLNTTERAVWNGSALASKLAALNYDKNSYGGWAKNDDVTTAFAVVIKQHYEYVIEAIDSLPDTLTITSNQEIEKVRRMYSDLSNQQKALVTNYSDLVAAEQAYNNYIAEFEQEIEDDIYSLSDLTLESSEVLKSVSDRINEYSYEMGLGVIDNIDNYADLKKAYQEYNDMVDYIDGDVDMDKSITSADALLALQAAVEKSDLTKKEKYAANVDYEGDVSSADALYILQYAVNKINAFPSNQYPHSAVQEKVITCSKKNVGIYEKTYKSLVDRVGANGYAPTSVTGAYEGMFGRDSAVQIMAHVQAGDYDLARNILEYTLNYHNTYGYNYILHKMGNNAKPLSDYVQVDATFFFLHAWYLFATNAPQTVENTQFIASYEGKVKSFANYFLDNGYLHSNNLIHNACFEHSREARYWKSYDLLTNTYASQALYELSLYFSSKDSTNSTKWRNAADNIVKGVNSTLTTTVDGKKIYAELIDTENSNRMIQGFSWVNLAPMGCNWYGADATVLENTYQAYLKYGAYNYHGNHLMLEACTSYNGAPVTEGNHVVGKGVAWEMLYCKKNGYNDRLLTLTAFIENYSGSMYPESFSFNGGVSDLANQEHAGWLCYANNICHSDMVDKKPTAFKTVRVSSYNVHIFQDVAFDYSVIANDITKNNIEIVGIQEVDNGANRSYKHDQAKELAKVLGWNYYYSKTIDNDGGLYGHAILSKYPIYDCRTISLTSTNEEQRVLGAVKIDIGGGKSLNMFNTHLTWSSLQATQFNEIANQIRNLDNFIITGDFNCTNFNAYSVLNGQMVNNAANKLVTNSDDGAIDNIVVSKNLGLSKGVLQDYGHSDHNMIYADVTVY